MSPQEQQKQAAAQAVLEYITDDMTVGVGTGSTVNYFIDALATIKHRINAAVASSLATEQRLKEAGVPLISLNAAGPIPLYVDGADEATHNLHLIKGGGGALTREKILAGAARQFICIIDQSKYVDRLGTFPLPVAVLPMARSYVAREIVKLGGAPVYREGFATDDGNIILDVHNLDILEPMGTEAALNNIPGVVANGLFTLRPADQLLIGTTDGSVRRVS